MFNTKMVTRASPLLLASLAVLAATPVARAAEPSIALAGRVSDAVSGAPVAGAEVRAGEAAVSRTDAQGRFALALAPGPWTVSVTASGYVPQSRSLSLVGPEPPGDLEIALVPAARFSEQVEVKASPPPEGPMTLPVAPRQVMAVAGSLDNIYHVIQTLPGVNATDDVSSRLSVRGGGPDENLTIMDGVEIHNPYRLLGLTSAFNPETVSHFEFSAGGFGVAYGDRLSSLLVVDNRDGNGKSGLSGSSSMSITDANVVLEGKLPVRRGAWLLTTRRTYYDLVANHFVHDAKLPEFGDIQLKASWEPRDGQKLTITGVRSREDGNGTFTGDVQDESGTFLLGVHNDVLSAAFQARLGKAVSRSVLAWYGTESTFDAAAAFRGDARRSNAPEDTASPVTSIDFQLHHDIRDVSVREELSLPLGARHALGTGFDVHRLRAGVHYSFLGDRNPSEANGSSLRGGPGLPQLLDSANDYTRGGTWLEDRFRATDALTLVGGLRLDASGMSHSAILSPRLSATLGFGPSTRLRASAGRYTQSPGYEKLIMSDYVVDQVDLDYERAWHTTVGVERDLGRGTAARLEAYYKSFDRLVIGRLETEAERQARIATYDYPPGLQSEIPTAPLITSTPSNDGRGTAYGLDLYVTRTGEHLSGWLSYTLGKAEREAYGMTYPFDYDRRHAATLVGSYRVSPRFEAAATARAFSGFPWTPFAGIRVASTEVDGRQVPERDTAGRLVYVVAAGDLSTLNSARLPFYFRVDLRATFRPHGDRGRWQFYVEALNAFARKNTSSIEGHLEYDPGSDRPRLVENRSGSLPFLPTFGVRFRFD